jgi:hypothetical protein
MKANGEDIKTIQELLRHSNYKVTADTQAVHSDETGGANQAGENDFPSEQESGGRARIRGVTFSYRTLSNPREKARFQ